MQEHKAIKTERYLNTDEIGTLLEDIEFIVMAAPAPDHFKETPIHITIFLNTQEPLPEGIKEQVFAKMCEEYGIKKSAEVMSQMMPVGFAQSVHDTPMPMLLVKPQDQATIPFMPLHVIDFLALSDQFDEVLSKGLTGWSYVKE